MSDQKPGSMSDELEGNACNPKPVGHRTRSTKKIAEAREEQAWALRAKGYTEKTIAAKLGITQQSVNEALARAAAKRLPLMVNNIAAMKAQQTAILEDKIETALLAWERSMDDAETERVVEKTIGKVKPDQEPQPQGGWLSRSEREPLTTKPDLDDIDLEDIPGLRLNAQGYETTDEERAAAIKNYLVERIKAGAVDPAAILERTRTTTSAGQVGDPRFLEFIRKCLADIRLIWGLDAPQKQELTHRDGDLTDEERSARIAALLDAGRNRRAGSAPY